MSEARTRILGTIRQALKTALLPDAAPQAPPHALPHPSGSPEQFIAELERVAGQVIRVESSMQAAQQIAALFAERAWRRVLAWDWAEIDCDGLAGALEASAVEVVRGGAPCDLETIPVGLTGALAGLADTGSLVVSSGAGRSPLASLLPPVHIAVLHAGRIYPDMPSFFDSLAAQGGAAEYVRSVGNLVFITGPSRTSDIEQILTLGVHGPRELIVLLVWPPP